MHTPGLPASPSSAPRTSADSFFSDQPSHAAEQFGEIMKRALHGDRPVRSEARRQNASSSSLDTVEHHDGKPSSAKAKKPLHRLADIQSDADGNNAANAHLTSLMAPTAPAATSTSNGSSGETHESPDAYDSISPVSADATNTSVTDANPTETETDNSTATPIPAGLVAQAAETASMEHTENSAPGDAAKALSTDPAEPPTDTAEPAVHSDSSPPSTQITELKGSGASPSASPPDPRGTSTAKQDVTMKKAEKMQKVAGPAEQELPGMTATGGEELPQAQKISEKAPLHSDKVEPTAMELPTRVSTSIDAPSATITSAEATPAPAIDARIVERTHDIVALHAMRLTDTGAESLHVVVKPGAGIQLSLELRQSARGIEVSASLHKGDYDQLNRHWPDLQQRLEARGVRVSTLTTAENYTGTSHQQFHQSKQQSPEDSLYAGAFAEFALAGSMTEAPGARAARASAYRGWETWA